MREKKCQITNQLFSLSAEEVQAFEAFDLPIPAVSPGERLRRRLAICSSGRFFWRSCDETKRKIFSVFPEEAAFPVVSLEYWLSPEWQPLDYGVDFNFGRSFFEQYLEFWVKVPRPSRLAGDDPSCAGSYQVPEVVSSFMTFNARSSVRTSYSSHAFNCTDCLDCYFVVSCEGCYECLYCLSSAALRFAEYCYNCTDSWFLSHCRNCSHCLFCTGLEGKHYHIFNNPVTPEEYEETLVEWHFSAGQKLEYAKEVFTQFLSDKPIPHYFGTQAAVNTGNCLFGCENADDSFECIESEDIRQCSWIANSKQCLEGLGFGGDLERCAQFVGLRGPAENVRNCIECGPNVSHLDYCTYCEDSSHLFSCIGLRGKEYCIMNKQLTKAKYFQEVAQIIRHLKTRGVWGKFFPPAFSGYAYNRSAANNFMPLARVPAQMMGFTWDDSEDYIKPSVLRVGADARVDESIAEIPDRLEELDNETARQAVFLCELSGRPFRLTREELEFYRRLGVAAPRRSFEERHRERLMRLPPRTMQLRNDAEGRQIYTAYPEAWRRPVMEYAAWENMIGEQTK